jgi:hypothetical protein
MATVQERAERAEKASRPEWPGGTGSKTLALLFTENSQNRQAPAEQRHGVWGVENPDSTNRLGVPGQLISPLGALVYFETPENSHSGEGVLRL